MANCSIKMACEKGRQKAKNVALWPKAVKKRGYALAIIKRFVPKGIACNVGVEKRRIGIKKYHMELCSAWHQCMPALVKGMQCYLR